jgi:alpha-methylacyl-CoA racemase
MMMSDMGAEVLRIGRHGKSEKMSDYVLKRGRRHTLTIDLKRTKGTETVLRLVERADALIEGFRPGVMERLGLGPEVCLARNPRLVYGRVTGWGQTGPLRHVAGHDINYIALTGALHAIGRSGERPVPPLNLIGDFGGGGMLLAFGLVCAIFEASRSGKGQVIDAAMTDGSALLMAMMYGFKAANGWKNERETNLLDGGAHFYDTYECADGKWVAIGSIEPQFYALLLDRMEIRDPAFQLQYDAARWPELKAKLASAFKSRTRQEWCELMEGSDVCFAPILNMDEAPEHAHNKARRTFVEIDGVIQPAPAPRFSRTVPEIQKPAATSDEQTENAWASWGFTSVEIATFKRQGMI